MAQIYSKSAKQPLREAKPVSRRSSRQRAQRFLSTDANANVGPPLSILGIPSPAIGDTSTTHNAMLFWIGWFARFHTDPDGVQYVPYELATIDCPVTREGGSALEGAHGRPQVMRCVRELARCDRNGQIEWLSICWEIGTPSVSFQKYSSFEDALAAFQAPPRPVSLS